MPAASLRLLQACWLGVTLACGGRTGSERSTTADAGAPAVSATCQGAECAGQPCETVDTCSQAPLHYEGCLPEACGEMSVCRYQNVTAAAAQQMLVCSCAGVAEVAQVGYHPVVFAHVFDHLFYECTPGYDEVCDRSQVVGSACDASLPEAPELTPVVVGSDLPFEDGVALLALDLGRSEPFSGSGTITGGAVSFPLEQAPVISLVFLVDENGDGQCSGGEHILRHAQELAPLEGLLRYVPVVEPERMPCEERLGP